VGRYGLDHDIIMSAHERRSHWWQKVTTLGPLPPNKRQRGSRFSPTKLVFGRKKKLAFSEDLQDQPTNEIMAPPVRRQQPSRKVKIFPLPEAVAPDSGPNTDSGPSSSRRRARKTPLSLRDRKWLSYKKYQDKSPFPSFPHPTRADVKTALSILTCLHGPRLRPAPSEVVAPANRSGCRDSPSVLDTLVRTILSQNTSDANSSRAKRSINGVYGSSDN